MRKALLRGMVRLSFVTLSSITLLAASPSSLVAAMDFAGEGVSVHQQIPGQSGGAPLHHIPGNAGTGDAMSKDSKSKSKGSKSKSGDSKSGESNDSVRSNDSAPSNDSVRSNDCTVGNSGQSKDSVKSADSGESRDSVATAGSKSDSGISGSRESISKDSGDTEDGEDRMGPNCGTPVAAATPVVAGTQQAPAGTTAGTTTFSSETIGNVTVATETTVFADGSRTIRIFSNGELTRTVQLAPGAILGSQQGQAGSVNPIGNSGSAVAGQESAAILANLANLPATSTPPVNGGLGILGASIAVAGAWLLRRRR